MTYILHAVIDLAGVYMVAFDAYEATVLPLLTEHRGRLIGRYRSTDGLTEVHVLGFDDEAAHAAYIADPRRQAAQHLRRRSGVRMQGSEMIAIGVDGKPLPDPPARV